MLKATGSTSGPLAALKGTGDADQRGLFDDDDDDAGPSDAGPSSGGPRPVTPAMRVPDKTNPTPCARSDRSEAWLEPDDYPYAIAQCQTCPFKQWCATEALSLTESEEYHVVGVWATIDFLETDRSGRYRRRIHKLEKIAATGVVPRTRPSPPAAPKLPAEPELTEAIPA